MGPCEQAGTYKNGGGIISILPNVGWLQGFLLANVGKFVEKSTIS
jgi:hypothetical protein